MTREQLRAWLQPAIDAVEARTLRERVLLVAATAALVSAGGYYALLEPALERIEAAKADREQAEAEIAEARAERAELEAELEADPDEHLREEIEALEDELAEIEAELEARLPNFIPPERMRAVLEGVLTEAPGVRLVRMERLPAESVIDAEDNGAAAIYRHPIEVVIEADYNATVAYLEAVEGLPWQLSWERIEYEVQDHPEARVTLRLATLSGHRAWLDI